MSLGLQSAESRTAASNNVEDLQIEGKRLSEGSSDGASASTASPRLSSMSAAASVDVDSAEEIKENPFLFVAQQQCSAEDAIRKGVFSGALRCVSSATDEQREAWRREIEVLSQPKVRQARKAKTAPAEAEAEAETALPSAGVNEGQGANENGKREREEATEEVKTIQAQEPLFLDSFLPEDGGQNDLRLKSFTASPVVESTEVPPTQPTQTAKEFIYAYISTLLNQVVGLSLNALSVPGLRVLCLLLGISRSSTSKELLYNLLANFHYTRCAKLGKRVSTNTAVLQRAEEEKELVSRIYGKKTSKKTRAQEEEKKPEGTATRPKKAAQSEQTATERPRRGRKADEPSTAAKSAAGRKRTSALDTNTTSKGGASSTTAKVPRKTRAGNAAAVTKNGGKAAPHRKEATDNFIRSESDASESSYTTSSYDASETESEELSIQHNARVFRNRNDTVGYRSGAPSHSYQANNTDAEEWSKQVLERKVASIMHMYDPITNEMAAQKLVGLGYPGSDAFSVCDRILRSFHERNLVVYDNGIAYST